MDRNGLDGLAGMVSAGAGGAGLTGKAVVVTGAGRGLGEAFAVHLARAGAAVVVNDVDAPQARRVARLIRDAGFPAVASTHSVADPAAAAAIVELCVAEYGGIHGLVNNAGLTYEALPWEDDPARARAVVEVNLLGVIHTGLAAIRRMRPAGGGSIVNISSGASLGQRTIGVYAATKGAVCTLTCSWALDLEDCGIRVNAVCPKAYTRMVWTSERAARHTPPDRTPDRVAPLVHFLLDDDRSAGITGQIIRCTGPELHIVGQPYLKAPVLYRDEWDVDAVTTAFAEVLGSHLEPYGLEKRSPSRLRKWLAPARTA